MSLSKTETDFIEQYARVHLVEWCCQTIEHGSIVEVGAVGETKAQKNIASKCLDFAIEKGWVGKSDPKKVLAKGFSTGAAFLKR